MAVFKYSKEGKVWEYLSIFDNGYSICNLIYKQSDNCLDLSFRKNGNILARFIHVDKGRQVCDILIIGDQRLKINGFYHGTMRLLKHKDEIGFGDDWIYYSAETIPQVVPNTKGQIETCPRCKGRIENGIMSVTCVCGLTYHETEKFNCWSYADTCICGHSTNMELEWRPDNKIAPAR